MEFREWLLMRMRAKGLRQGQLAAYGKVSPAAVSDWATGKRHPRPAMLRLIAQPLGATYEEALEAAGYLTPEEQASDDRTPPIHPDLAAVLRGLDWEEQAALAGAARLLLRRPRQPLEYRVRGPDRRRSAAVADATPEAACADAVQGA